MVKDKMECKCGHTLGGGMMLILGVIILVNAYWPFANWGALLGILLVLIGIKSIAMSYGCRK